MTTERVSVRQSNCKTELLYDRGTVQSNCNTELLSHGKNNQWQDSVTVRQGHCKTGSM